jgi:hypothetical protein
LRTHPAINPAEHRYALPIVNELPFEADHRREHRRVADPASTPAPPAEQDQR